MRQAIGATPAIGGQFRAFGNLSGLQGPLGTAASLFGSAFDAFDPRLTGAVEGVNLARRELLAAQMAADASQRAIGPVRRESQACDGVDDRSPTGASINCRPYVRHALNTASRNSAYQAFFKSSGK